MSGIKVSVVMPVYNAECFLRQALETLQAQKLKEIEMICVDDGSTDRSLEILEEFANYDPRMTVLRHTEYTDGAAEARNIGMNAAKGEYLAFVDADDFFCPEMLEHAYNKAKVLDVDVLMFDAWYYDDELHVVYEDHAPLEEAFLPRGDIFRPSDNISGIFRMTHGASWGRLFRRSFIKDKKIDFFSCRYWDDIAFVYVALCEAEKIGILREKLLYYRHNHATSQTRDKGGHAEIGIKAPYELKRRFEERKLYKTYRVPLVNCVLSRAFWMLSQMETADLYEEMFFSLKNGYLGKLGAFELENDEFYSGYLPRWRDVIIRSSSAFEFMVAQNYNIKGIARPRFLLELGKCAPHPGKMVIYGAGTNGKKAFIRLVGGSRYSLCAWVDRKYKEIGFPVQPPETLKILDFDYILIAIEDNHIANEVTRYLLSMGIEKTKIIWIPNIALCE